MDYKRQLDSVVRSGPSYLKAPVGLRHHAGERSTPFEDRVWSEFVKTLTQADFIQYPDDRYLVQSLAEMHNVDASNIMMFAGADAALDCIVNCFAEDNTEIIMPEYRFPMYDVYAAKVGAKIVNMRYDGFTLTPTVDCVVTNPRLVLLANPNSPVGDSPSAELFARLETYNVPIIVDSVYSDFGSTQLDVLQCINKDYVFVHSFSKSFGGCGARIGYVIANPAILSILNKARSMVSVTGSSIKFATWALANIRLRDEYVAQTVSIRNKVHLIIPWNIGGNWVHIPTKCSVELDRLGVTYKNNCYLPSITTTPLIRVSASYEVLPIVGLR